MILLLLRTGNIVTNMEATVNLAGYDILNIRASSDFQDRSSTSMLAAYMTNMRVFHRDILISQDGEEATDAALAEAHIAGDTTCIHHTTLKMTPAYSPQADGQTERMMNRLLQEIMRSNVQADQLNWLELLDGAMMAINNSPVSATQKSPFEMETGLAMRIRKPRARAHERSRMEDLPSLLSSSGAGKANA